MSKLMPQYSHMPPTNDSFRSVCPLATALDVVGDKWSLLLIRDMCRGKKRYSDFSASPEGIPTNILANRLKRLETTGLIKKNPYQNKPLRYEYALTVKGANLLPVLQQLAIWAHKFVPGCMPPYDWFINAKPENLIQD
jgi:DNA-binding HxlR family transcriptional regulator